MASDASSGTVTKWNGDGPRQVQSSPLNVSLEGVIVHEGPHGTGSSAGVAERLAAADAGVGAHEVAGVRLRGECRRP